MDKLTSCRNLIKRILSEYVELSNRQLQPRIGTTLIMDETGGHYICLKLGWADGKRQVHNSLCSPS
jgi:XisI protein